MPTQSRAAFVVGSILVIGLVVGVAVAILAGRGALDAIARGDLDPARAQQVARFRLAMAGSDETDAGLNAEVIARAGGPAAGSLLQSMREERLGSLARMRLWHALDSYGRAALRNAHADEIEALKAFDADPSSYAEDDALLNYGYWSWAEWARLDPSDPDSIEDWIADKVRDDAPLDAAQLFDTIRAAHSEIPQRPSPSTR